MTDLSSAVTMDASIPQQKSFFRTLTEDWWAVLIGGSIILLFLIIAAVHPAFKPTLPVYQWADGAELRGKVLTAGNIIAIIEAGIVFLFLSAIAIALSGGSVKKYMAGFAFIYILAIISLLLAGNKTISYYGLEYVVFALILGLYHSYMAERSCALRIFYQNRIGDPWYQYPVYRYCKSGTARYYPGGSGGCRCVGICLVVKPQIKCR